MDQHIKIENIQVAHCLFNFIEEEVLPQGSVKSDVFWANFSKLVTTLTPINKALLDKRESLQTQIDQWHQDNKGLKFDASNYKRFLTNIGYISPEIDDFNITTENVDPELATMAGPQLVVPIMNARFAINAVNARWGSLYDALYGTDVISEDGGAERSGAYNPVRGQQVIRFAREFLDKNIPLANGSHHEVTQYSIIDNQLVISLESPQGNTSTTTLADQETFLGFSGSKTSPETLLFSHHGLRFEINFDQSTTLAKSDKAGISDITLESALTTIMDCEDSVAAVDAQDKVIAYRNWLGLTSGTLEESIIKNGKNITRTMAKNRYYQNCNGEELILSGRSLMFIRNVGHLMTNNAILLSNGDEVPEGIIDAMVTSLIASQNLTTSSTSNSSTRSIYIVKPKMHGPEEVAFANTLFEQVEDALSLNRNTIKMGIMDEERRTSVNLKACIAAAKTRVVFINTGFLDRTGDEIHTSMAAGAMMKKADIKNTPWIKAYEDNNVDIGLACGFSGKAQIGKGMWPIPDQMANMLSTKINHVLAGANTAWVPSPTAATLHALHYHSVDVFTLQQEIKQRVPAKLDDILTLPLAENTQWNEEEITQELDNNAQGILGYVVRWIDSGIGCSKVPDINNIGLMEDRATLRISSQHIANWLMHGICTQEQVMGSMKKMAKKVDSQNAYDSTYQAMAENFEHNIAFKAACDLIFLGAKQPSGYTEPLLHAYRRKIKCSE
jgi:malate synthase